MAAPDASAEAYSQCGDIDQLLEDVLMAPMNFRQRLTCSRDDRAKLGDQPTAVAPFEVYAQVEKKPLSSAVENLETQLERLRQIGTASGTGPSVSQRCQSYEVLEQVRSFRVYPPLPPPPAESGQIKTVGRLDDEDVECATEVTALRPIGRGIHTLKSYSRTRLIDTRSGLQQQQQQQQQQQHQQSQQQQQQQQLFPFPRWQHHQSTPSLQPSHSASPHLGGLRAATIQASSSIQRQPQESLVSAKQTRQQHLAGGPQITNQEADESAKGVHGSIEIANKDGLLDAVRDTCRLWYQPMLSRKDASARLINQPAGSFLIRRSANHPDSYDLVVRAPATADTSARPVRHLLVERRNFAGGVAFAIAGDTASSTEASSSDSLAALIVANIRSASSQLPCRLVLPESLQLATAPGIECAALYLAGVDVETATGAAAIARATEAMMRCRHRLTPRPCRLAVRAKPAPSGLRVDVETATGAAAIARVLHCGFDPCLRSFDSDEAIEVGVERPRIFGFVLRQRSDRVDNCVLLACDNFDQKRAANLVQSVRHWLGL